MFTAISVRHFEVLNDNMMCLINITGPSARGSPKYTPEAVGVDAEMLGVGSC